MEILCLSSYTHGLTGNPAVFPRLPVDLLKGAGLCEGEEVCQLVEERERLGDQQEPVLGYAHPSLGE